jgi:hypothetical protein
MNLSQLLLAAHALNRFYAIEQLKDMLDKKFQTSKKNGCFTIFYTDKHPIALTKIPPLVLR